MKLEDHLNSLPKHHIDDDMWDKIESHLVSETPVSWLEKLPLHTAKNSLWDPIEEKLTTSNHYSLLSLQRIAVAASIVLIAMVGNFIYQRSHQDLLVYSGEIIIETTHGLESNFDPNAINVLENCDQYPSVCKSPSFTRLKHSLDRLKIEENKLRLMQKDHSDPQLEIYHTRIVRDIQRIEQQILEMFS